jgi:2-methylcitrate dehydratase PrpD
MSSTASQTLLTWGLDLTLDDIPSHAQHAACRHLLDGVGLSIVARRTDAALPSVRVARSLGGPPDARMLGDVDALSAPAAAMADGALVHAFDYDDTHAGGLVHATAVVLPAAFAVGQHTRSTGAEVLAAAVFGYEVVCRVAMGSPHGFHARGLHATQVAGVFSSAAVTAKLGGMDFEDAVNAFGIAGSSAGGLLEFLTTGASTKQLHPGGASMNGMIAARLAAAGATGPSTVLEGPHGVYAALSARPFDIDAVVGELGARWEVTRITIKPYPSCQLMHVTLDALRTVLDDIPSAEAVASITAFVHPDSAPTVCEPAEVKIRPRTSYDAKFSLPWSVAALIVDGDINVGTYDLDSVLRPEVADVSARVTSVVQTLNDGVAADAPGRVEVTLVDGTMLVGEIERSLGGPDRPLTDEQLLAKFYANCGGENPTSRELAQRVLNLADEADLTAIHDLAAALVAAPADTTENPA